MAISEYWISMSRIPNPRTETIQRAQAGDWLALDEVLRMIQPGIYALALRMMGHKEDARDATQEILLRVTTHLSQFSAQAQFPTWAYQVARNHLLNCVTRAKEAPTYSFEDFQKHLDEGLLVANAEQRSHEQLQPEEKLAAKRMGLACTQGMLMCLDRDQRIAYILDAVLGFDSKQAAEILQIPAATFRKRLQRARDRLETFAQKSCGLVSSQASCQCSHQVAAVQTRFAAGQPIRWQGLAVTKQEAMQVQSLWDDMEAASNITALLRSHPNYQAPENLLAAIRVLLVERFQSSTANPAKPH
ncbi:MAG: RNA polymerase sigma factor [Brachymonas sp.]